MQLFEILIGCKAMEKENSNQISQVFIL